MPTINWETGSYTVPGKENDKSTFRVTVGSDWGALWGYAEPMQRDALAVYGDLLPILQESDFNIVNVECALGDKGAPVKKAGPNLRGAAGTERCLTAVPFHLGTLSNNHIMDFGPDSLEETIGVLHNNGIKTVGAGMSLEEAAQPAIVQIKNATLGIINCGEGEACASIDGRAGANPFHVPAIVQQIHTLKTQVDAVVVIFHGGREYAPCPPPYVVDGLRQFAEAGADAVIGHHPHVPQGIEIHQGTPIAYSQGNFVFLQDAPNGALYFKRSGYLIHLDFAGKELREFSITPYRLKPEGVFALQGDEKTQLLDELKTVSAYLDDPRAIRYLWDAFVDNVGQKGMLGTIHNMQSLFEEDAETGAARLHNLFFCPAHRELYLNGLKRLSRGELGNSPQWAKDLVADWGKRLL